MGDIELRDGGVTVRLTVAERLLALHWRPIHADANQIVGAETCGNVFGAMRGWRAPGTGFPRVIALGTWAGKQDGRRFRDFVLIHGRGPGVVVHLRNHRYSRLLLRTDGADEVVSELT